MPMGRAKAGGRGKKSLEGIRIVEESSNGEERGHFQEPSKIIREVLI